VERLHAHLLDAASRAPSAHNTQPWRLSLFANRLEVRVPRDRMLPAADAASNDALHAVGALIENLLLTLAQLDQEGSYRTAARLEPGTPVVTLGWRPATSPRPDPTLYRMIPVRRTSRLRYRPDPAPDDALAAISDAARPCTLYAIREPARRNELRRLVQYANIRLLADGAIARELHGWLRFSRRDPRWYRDGLNAACMGWSGLDAALARRLLAPRVVGALARIGLHRALCADLDQQSPPAPVICLLAMPGDGVAARIEAGRCLERVWLTAAAHGLVTHPLSAAVDVAETRPRALELFGMSRELAHVNLFRLGSSAPPARSPRLPVDEILESEPECLPERLEPARPRDQPV
jgi:nitroreductase